MVFWDSRTIHCGTEAVRKRNEKKLRNVVYICMAPRERTTGWILFKFIQLNLNKIRLINKKL